MHTTISMRSSIFFVLFLFSKIAFTQSKNDADTSSLAQKALSIAYSMAQKITPGCPCCKVETEPRFGNSEEDWQHYLNSNIDTCTARRNEIPSGNYGVVIHFVIAKDGSLENIHAITCCGYGLEEEAIRVLKMSPKWMPATQNGRLVRKYKTQMFCFNAGGTTL